MHDMFAFDKLSHLYSKVFEPLKNTEKPVKKKEKEEKSHIF